MSTSPSTSPSRNGHQTSPPTTPDLATPASANPTTPQTTTYTNPFKVFKRSFKTQTSGPEHPSIVINSNSLTEFKQMLFNSLSTFMEHEVIVSQEDPKYSWSTTSTLTLDDLSKFILFKEEFGGKRTHELATVTTNKLVAWKDKYIVILVISYSTSITSGMIFKEFEKALLTPAIVDRSNAAAMQIQTLMIARLKATHTNLSGVDISESWSLWVDDILKQPAHLHDLLVNQGPLTLSHLFRISELHSGVQRQMIISSNQVAIGENESNKTRLAGLRQAMNVLKRNFDFMNNLLTQFEENNDARSGFLRDTSTALNATEQANSSLITDAVTNLADFEHGATAPSV